MTQFIERDLQEQIQHAN